MAASNARPDAYFDPRHRDQQVIAKASPILDATLDQAEAVIREKMLSRHQGGPHEVRRLFK